MRAAQDRRLFIKRKLTDLELSVSAQGAGGEGLPSSGKLSSLQRNLTSSSAGGEMGRSYESQKDALTRHLEELQSKYTDNHPDVIVTKRKLADLETKKDT